MAIEIGLQGHSETLVEQEDTAKSVGSGDLLVYATPCMAALMEGAACESIAPYLAEGETSVGVSLQLFHTAATPVGMNPSSRRSTAKRSPSPSQPTTRRARSAMHSTSA